MSANSKTSRRPHHGLVPAALCLGAVAVVLPFATQIYFSVRSDRAAAAREKQVVQNGLDGRTDEIARLMVPQVVWDDAVENLDRRFNTQWAAENIGAFLHNANNFETALVLDRRDAIIFASNKGNPVAVAEVQSFADATATLVHRVRAAEQARGPLDAAVAQGKTLSSPIVTHAITLVDNRPMLLAAALVQPDFGTATPLTDRSAIVVVAKPLDATFVETLRQRFLLQDLRMQLGPPPADDRTAQATLRDARGVTVASLVWRPPAPGTEMLQNSLAPMAAIIALLCALGMTLALRSRKATERLVASERRSNHLAYHDVLTGLPNRAMLNDRLGAALESLRRSGRPVAVLCLDLDRFKDVNDTFGHEAGDELIRTVGKVLKDNCRASDTVARLGGDEFAIVQTDADADAASALSTKIITTLSQPIHLTVGRVHVGCSIGIAQVTDPQVSAQEALRRADLALYRAKDQGRGRLSFFESDLDTAQRMRRALKEDLRDALAQNALTVVYQPQVGASGEITGFEALARWTHPHHGAVSPTVFVPLAEETGLIDALGLHVMRRAFDDSRSWPGLTTAINVSASQLRMKDFAAKIEAMVAEAGVTPSHFELEITEGVLLGDDPQTLEALMALRKLGFAIALDDFGTGYSSLSYLQRYPIDRIKIDRSFITNLGADGEAADVVAAIVRLARALKLSVTAEGVETERQRMQLTTVGCRDMQGFLFGEPMSFADARARSTRDAAPPTGWLPEQRYS